MKKLCSQVFSRVAGSEDYFFANYELADDAKKFEKNDYNFCTRVPEARHIRK